MDINQDLFACINKCMAKSKPLFHVLFFRGNPEEPNHIAL